MQAAAPVSVILSLLPYAIILLVVFGICYVFYPAYVALEGSTRPIPEAKVIGSVKQRDDVLLSIVIPSYNEKLRLPIMLREAVDYLSQKSCASMKHFGSESGMIEWIVVDDGSSDQTGLAFQEFVGKEPRNVRMSFLLVTLPQNRGKGAAVQAGMLAASGKYLLFVDADGATSFGPGLEALSSALPKAPGSDFVLMGSRAHIQQERSLARRFLAGAFRFLLALTLGPDATNIRDTQCGFKLFSRHAAERIFQKMHLQRWGFDIEVLYLAVHLKFIVGEEVVPWHEVEGSKLNTSVLNLALVSLSMLRDMICVRLCYELGVWNYDNDVTKND